MCAHLCVVKYATLFTEQIRHSTPLGLCEECGTFWSSRHHCLRLVKVEVTGNTANGIHRSQGNARRIVHGLWFSSCPAGSGSAKGNQSWMHLDKRCGVSL